MQLCLRCHKPCGADSGFCQQCHSSLLTHANLDARTDHQIGPYQTIPLLPLGSYPRAEIQLETHSTDPKNDFATDIYWSIEPPQQSSPAPQLAQIEPLDKQSDSIIQGTRQSTAMSDTTARPHVAKVRSYVYLSLCSLCILSLLTFLFMQFHTSVLQAKPTTGYPLQSANSPGASSSGKQSSSTPLPSPTARGFASTSGSAQPALYTTPPSFPTSASNTTPPMPVSTIASSIPPPPVNTSTTSGSSVTIVPTSFSAVATQGQGDPAPTTITITNTENRDLSWQASDSSNWLNLNSSAGNIATGQSINLSVGYSSTGLASGSYHTQIQVSVYDATNSQVSAQNIQVTFTIVQPCTLQISPTSLAFSAVLLQKNIQGQNIMLTESGNCNYPITWKANVDAASYNWLILTTSSGTDAGAGGTLTVNVKTQNSVLGTYHGQITFSAIDNGGMSVSVNTGVTVKFTVLASL